MSNIKELANVPEISFIENMSLQETEELVRANYLRVYKELTGEDGTIGEADTKNLLIKSFIRTHGAAALPALLPLRRA